MGNNCFKDSSKTAHSDSHVHSPQEKDYLTSCQSDEPSPDEMTKRPASHHADGVDLDNADSDGPPIKKPKHTVESIELDPMDDKSTRKSQPKGDGSQEPNKASTSTKVSDDGPQQLARSQQEPTHMMEALESNISNVSLSGINVNANDQRSMQDPKANVEVKQKDAGEEEPQPKPREKSNKLKKLEKDLKDKTDEVQSLERRLKEMEKGLKKDLTEKDAELEKVRSKLDDAKQKLENTKYSKHDRQRENGIAQLKADLNESNREREELLTRLSAFAGAQLLNNNPNIADLSDSNRPTKLAEQYSELYDNQWTDAFSALEETGLSENECIKLLLDILVNIYRICKNKADSQDKALEDSVSEFLQGSIFPPEMIKHFKESRKKNYKMYIPQLKQVVNSKLKSPGQMTDNQLEATDAFQKECLIICWLMCIQDPPVYIDCNVNLRGKNFEKGSFKAYTKSGPIIEFVVWPIVYLHIDGPMLSKGVAQGTASKDDLIKPNESFKRDKDKRFSQSLYTHSSKVTVSTSDKRRTVPGDPSKTIIVVDRRPQSMSTHVSKYTDTKQIDAMSTHMNNIASTDTTKAARDMEETPTNTKETPTNTKEAPTNTKEVPTNTKEAPVDTKEAPAVTKEDPAVTKEAPTDTKEALTDIKEPSTNKKTAPTDMQEISTDTKKGLTDQKEASTNITEASTEMKETSTDMEEASIDIEENKVTKL